MLTHTIPGTNLRPRQVGLGTADLGLKQSEADAHRLLDRFTDLGGNLIDTARIYSDWAPGETGRSERVIGDWLQARGRRDDLIITTKGAHPPMDDMTRHRLDEAALRADVELSLAALRTDHIDLYWLHRDAPELPVEPIIDALNRIRAEEKISWFGASNWSAARIAVANAYATRTNQYGFVASQPMWCLGSDAMRPLSDPTLTVLDSAERDATRDLGIALLPYSAQANGFFSKAIEGPGIDESNHFATAPNLARLDPIRQLAVRHDCRVNAIVLAYLTSQNFAVIPIVGCHRIDQLENTFADLEVRLSPTELATLAT